MTPPAAVPVLARQGLDLLPPAPGDLVGSPAEPERIARHAATGIRRGTGPSGPARFAWPLSGESEPDPAPAPFLATSREYWLDATGADLLRGVALPVDAPGALVRIQPEIGSGASSVDPAKLVVSKDKGRPRPAPEAMELIVPPEALQSSRAPFPPGTCAFQLAASLGAGDFSIRAPGPRDAEARYVVHVLDRGSSVQGAVRTLQSTVHAGGTLTIEAGLLRPGEVVPAEEVEAYLSAPGGRRVPVPFTRFEDRHRAVVALPDDVPTGRGLWEVVASVHARVAGRTVRRTVRSAFDVALPTAFFGRRATLDRARGFRIEIPVRAAAPGRYEVRGVLFGTDPRGILRPLAVAHGADDLEAGRATLPLVFERELLAASGLRAPFEVRGLELRDQGRLAVLHRQERGLLIDG